MIKTLTFLKRKPGISKEEFLHHWLEIHGPLAASKVPGLRKFVQCHPVLGFESEIDGIVELWWDDINAFKAFMAWRQTDASRLLREDEEKFIDTQRVTRFVAEEHLIPGVR
jgi:uncharacterized protein (TIGR02118 family)